MRRFTTRYEKEADQIEKNLIEVTREIETHEEQLVTLRDKATQHAEAAATARTALQARENQRRDLEGALESVRREKAAAGIPRAAMSAPKDFRADEEEERMCDNMTGVELAPSSGKREMLAMVSKNIDDTADMEVDGQEGLAPADDHGGGMKHKDDSSCDAELGCNGHELSARSLRRRDRAAIHGLRSIKRPDCGSEGDDSAKEDNDKMKHYGGGSRRNGLPSIILKGDQQGARKGGKHDRRIDIQFLAAEEAWVDKETAKVMAMKTELQVLKQAIDMKALKVRCKQLL